MRSRALSLLVLLTTLTACGGSGSGDQTPSTAASVATAEPTVTHTQAATPAAEPFTPQPLPPGVEPAPADINFAQMMIGHHMQALDLVDLARQHSDNEELLALADEIEAAQGPEIEQMSWWVAQDWGYEVLDPADHEDHVMPGMMTRDELTHLATLTGAEFDQAWLEGMIFHHQGAIDMANDELAAGTVPQVREMAQEVIAVQQGEIDRMRIMISELPS
ncbi:MAG: DUF305 domain-containing protein [Beutenbergiaceae bacterium]